MIVCFEGIDGCGKSTAASYLASKINSLNRGYNKYGIDKNESIYATVFSISDFARRVSKYGLEEALCHNYGTTSINNFKEDYEAYAAIKDKLQDKSFSAPIVNCGKEIQNVLNKLENGDKSSSTYDALALGYLKLGSLITPILEHYDEYGHYIILDRWIWSTIVYNAAIPNTMFSSILDNPDLSSTITAKEDKAREALENIIQPELTILLDINTRLATHRRTVRGYAESELENIRYQAIVKSGYEALLYFMRKPLNKMLSKRLGTNIYPSKVEIVYSTEYTSEVGETVKNVIDTFFKYFR